MKSIVKILALSALIVLPLGGWAETYRLQNGETLEGDVVRVEENKVVLRTSTGISTYHVNQFEYETKKSIMTRYGIQKTVKTADSVKEALGISFSDPEYIYVLSGLLLIFVAFVWLVIAGFAESPIWGIAIILANFLGGLAFAVLHFRRAKWPLLLTVVGLALVGFGIYRLAEVPPP